MLQTFSGSVEEGEAVQMGPIQTFNTIWAISVYGKGAHAVLVTTILMNSDIGSRRHRAQVDKCRATAVSHQL